MNQPLFRFLATKNYKNLALDKNINLAKLNIFIGSNGSGKSNFINCLKFLKNSLTTIADESRGVSSFENAVAEIGGNRILDGKVASPAFVRLAYCFSQISQPGTSGRNNAILDLKIYVDQKNQPRVSISEELLYSGEYLYEPTSSTPFYYYKFHSQEVGKGVVSLYNTPPNSGGTHFEPLDNIHTNSLGLSSIPRLLESSQYPPESTPVYKIRRELVEFISTWQFYAVVVWVFAGGGEAEVRGLIPFLFKNFPGCRFERKTPVRQKPGPKPNKAVCYDFIIKSVSSNFFPAIRVFAS